MTRTELKLLQEEMRTVRERMHALGIHHSDGFFDLYKKICSTIVDLSDMIDNEEDSENGTEK